MLTASRSLPLLSVRVFTATDSCYNIKTLVAYYSTVLLHVKVLVKVATSCSRNNALLGCFEHLPIVTDKNDVQYSSEVKKDGCVNNT